MYGFILKKNFCDVWDNLLTVIIVNLVHMLSASGILYLWALLTKSLGANTLDIVSIATTCGFITLWNIIHYIITFAFGEQAVKICNFEGIRIRDFFLSIPGCIVDAIKYGIFISLLLFLSIFLLYFYWFSGSKIGIFVFGIIFWIDIFLILSLQWFCALRCTMHNNFRKCLRKCFIIFFDNTGFSILVALNNLVLFIFSVLFVGLIPSIGAMVINNQNNLRIRLYKYDYLEEHPELNNKKDRKKIPWEELIYDDRETLGPRKFKSFLFPWKEN